MFDIVKNAIDFFFKYEDDIFSFKLQHNFRIYYRFDFTKNKELCINYDFKDLIIKTNNISILISLGLHYFNENNLKTVKQQSLKIIKCLI